MRGIPMALALLLVACGGEEADLEPDPVAPVEVTPDEAEALRARVAELEAELAQCRGGDAEAEAEETEPQPPTMEPIPEGVDVPSGVTTPEPVGSREPVASNTANEEPSERRGRRDEEDGEGSLVDVPFDLLGL